jgi:hypothetical protein
LRDKAAIDDEFGAGDERGFVGGEEQYPVGDLDRSADAAERGQRDLASRPPALVAFSIGGM